MKRISFIALVLALLMVAPSFTARADITMPKRDSFYDKLGRGLANVCFSSSELLDSQYAMIDTEGTGTAFCKGFLVQGVSRMIMDMGQGVFEIVTSPFPTQVGGSYRSQKLPPYDSMVVNDYPPLDLKNWY
jgi:putative exosortase-associated protein (TIGR04073 family)